MFFVRAEVAELVDALGSGSSPGFRVGVPTIKSIGYGILACLRKGFYFVY
jgi:hypothetical protein